MKGEIKSDSEEKKVPIRKDPLLQKREMDHKIISEFLGDKNQNTETTQQQRMLLTGLRTLADGSSWEVSKKLSTKSDDDFWKSPFLKEWEEQFYLNGVSVGRKGRSEAEKVAVSMFEADKALANAEVERSRILR